MQNRINETESMTDMSKWAEEQERRRDDKERRRVSREMFGKFFFDLAKLTFGTVFLAGVISLITDHNQGLLVIIGFCLTCILASISYYIMKY